MTASLGLAGVPGLTSGLSGGPPEVTSEISEVFILESEFVLRWLRSFLGRGGGVEGTYGKDVFDEA